MTPFEKALLIAAKAHEGQADKDGKEYIRHVLRVVAAVPEGDEQVVALLHDVVEDSETTLEHLRSEGFDGNIFDAVDAMTRRDNEDYFDFVRRAIGNPLARPVKIADLQDNLRRSSDPGSTARSERYLAALKMIGERSR